MRKIGLIFMFLWGVGFVAAQEYTDIKVSQLPKATQGYIAENFKGTQPSRVVRIDDKGTINYGVIFESGGMKKVLVFDKDGKFIQKGDKGSTGQQQINSSNGSGTGTIKSAGNSTTPIAVDKLPATTQTYIKTTYPAGKIAVSNQLTENSLVFYQVTVIDGNKSHVMTFDSKGKYISEQTFIKH